MDALLLALLQTVFPVGLEVRGVNVNVEAGIAPHHAAAVVAKRRFPAHVKLSG